MINFREKKSNAPFRRTIKHHGLNDLVGGQCDNTEVRMNIDSLSLPPANDFSAYDYSSGSDKWIQQKWFIQFNQVLIKIWLK